MRPSTPQQFALDPTPGPQPLRFKPTPKEIRHDNPWQHSQKPRSASVEATAQRDGGGERDRVVSFSGDAELGRGGKGSSNRPKHVDSWAPAHDASAPAGGYYLDVTHKTRSVYPTSLHHRTAMLAVRDEDATTPPRGLTTPPPQPGPFGTKRLGGKQKQPQRRVADDTAGGDATEARHDPARKATAATTSKGKHRDAAVARVSIDASVDAGPKPPIPHRGSGTEQAQQRPHSHTHQHAPPPQQHARPRHDCNDERCCHNRNTIIDGVMLQSKLDSVEADLRASQQSVAQLRRALQAREAEVEEAHREQERSTQHVEYLESERQSLRLQCEQLADDLAASESDQSALHAERRRWEERLRGVEDALRAKDIRIAELEQNLAISREAQLPWDAAKPQPGSAGGKHRQEGLNDSALSPSKKEGQLAKQLAEATATITALERRVQLIEREKREFLGTIKEQTRQLEAQRELSATAALQLPGRLGTPQALHYLLEMGTTTPK